MLAEVVEASWQVPNQPKQHLHRFGLHVSAGLRERFGLTQGEFGRHARRPRTAFSSASSLVVAVLQITFVFRPK